MFAFLLVLIAAQLLKLNESTFGSLVMLAAVSILYRVTSIGKRNFIRKLKTDVASGRSARSCFLQLLQTQHLLKGQGFIESDWLRDALQKYWFSHLMKPIQEQLKRKTYNEFTSSDGTIIRFEKFVLKEEIAPVFKDITPEESLRNDSVTLQTRVIFLGSVWLWDTRKDEKIVFKDISFRGMARVVFRPLSDEFPFFSGFVFHLISTPVIDSDLNLKSISESAVSFEDAQNFFDFIVNECTSGYVYPKQICIPLTKDMSVKRSIRFPDASVLCAIHVIDVEGLLDRRSKVSCCLRVGKETFKSDLVAMSKRPQFVAIHDAYERCSLQIFEKRGDSEALIGEIKFTELLTTLLFAKFKGSERLNGTDFRMPLEKSHTSVHFRLAVFQLDNNFRSLYKTLNAMQSLTDTLRKLSNFESKEISAKSKERKLAKLEITFNENKFETKEETISNGKYSWNTGFNLLNEDSEHKGIIEFSVIEKTTSKPKVVAKASLSVKDIVDERQKIDNKGNTDVNIESFRKVVFKKISTNERIPTVDYGKVELFVSVKVVKIDMTTLTNFSDSLKGSTFVHTLLPNRNTAVPTLITPPVEEKEESNVNKQIPKEITHKDSTENECAVKLQLSYISKSTLCVNVICAKNLPVFDDGENPNPGIIVELWKNNVKVTQKSTKFSHRTRDPFYGRKLQFQVTEDSIGKYILRILVASRLGFFLKKTVLIAELFKQLPILDSTGEKGWYKLNVIRVNNSTSHK
ncbi:extended synaptotagmin-1-like isoform X3 [Leptotrombidium deliense]|uniref:Extended synaptotagmin-1-like isoform X3 n=1 Tax=Leptotrombidium deliense TaxID=299467 RepID=A0A443SGR9_9ACAR|nr:extended synaptotagmin-1-like isoform X3 [Leptotrombidium deliense]